MEKKPETLPRNYLIQSNFFTQSVMRDCSELQKDIIYYLLTQINFHDPDPTGEIHFDYLSFLAYKKTNLKDSYPPEVFKSIICGLMHTNGMFYNKYTKQTVFFNLIDNVSVNLVDNLKFTVKLADYGKIFFFEKYLLDYAEQTQIHYTQIEQNIIDLQGTKRKKLFELLSQYKQTGFYTVSVEQLKTILGFIHYELPATIIPVSSAKRQEMQLKLLFSEFDEETFTAPPSPSLGVKTEHFKLWSDFRKNFLEPAINSYNSNPLLDISNITYLTKKTGRKVTGLEFHFKKRLRDTEFSEKEKSAFSYFAEYGLTENQVLFLLQRIGVEEMHRRFNLALTFNNYYDKEGHKYYRQKIWFENSTGNPVEKLGGYLYENIYPELKSGINLKGKQPIQTPPQS